MTAVQPVYRIVADSPFKFGDLLVTDDAGHVWLFLGSLGVLSRRPLAPECVADLRERCHWSAVADTRPYTVPELCAYFSGRRQSPRARNDG